MTACKNADTDKCFFATRKTEYFLRSSRIAKLNPAKPRLPKEPTRCSGQIELHAARRRGDPFCSKEKLRIWCDGRVWCPVVWSGSSSREALSRRRMTPGAGFLQPSDWRVILLVEASGRRLQVSTNSCVLTGARLHEGCDGDDILNDHGSEVE